MTMMMMIMMMLLLNSDASLSLITTSSPVGGFADNPNIAMDRLPQLSMTKFSRDLHSGWPNCIGMPVNDGSLLRSAEKLTTHNKVIPTKTYNVVLTVNNGSYRLCLPCRYLRLHFFLKKLPM